MKRITKIILLINLVSVPFITAQEKITLSQAITTALNQNSTLIQTSNSLKISEASVKSAYGGLLPTLNLNGGWSWQRVSNNQGNTQIDYLGNIENVGESQIDSRNYNLSLGGNFTVFDGLSSFKNISQKKTDLESAKLDLEKLKQDAILQTVNLFVLIMNYQKTLKFQEEDLKYNKDLLEKIKGMHELKMIANFDLYSQEYQTANSQLILLQAESEYEKAKLNLLTYLSKDITKEYTFELDSSYVLDVINDLDNPEILYQTALNRRADFNSQKLKLESGEYQLSIAKSGLYPNISGNYGFSTSAVKLGDIFNRKVYNFGLSLNIPIFSGWMTEYSIESALVQIKNSNEQLSALERQIKTEVKAAMLDLKSTQLQLEVTKTAVKSAKETWDIQREKYKLGTVTYIDQQLAYRDFVQATNNSITAESNYIYKQFTLLNALGLLNNQ
ncbi:MAG: TolC family protein [Ignavibacteriales bacterium]|nr:MAG: TolC family protein [Ignavibacteriales bacterium]